MDCNIDKETLRLGTILIGIAGIVIIECYALKQGIDGTMMMSSFTIIGAAIGYVFKK